MSAPTHLVHFPSRPRYEWQFYAEAKLAWLEQDGIQHSSALMHVEGATAVATEDIRAELERLLGADEVRVAAVRCSVVIRRGTDGRSLSRASATLACLLFSRLYLKLYWCACSSIAPGVERDFGV